MVQLAEKTHFDKHFHFDRRRLVARRSLVRLARVNSAVMLGVIGGGLAICVLGAAIYDLERLFSSW
jgi:hypothetical protein